MRRKFVLCLCALVVAFTTSVLRPRPAVAISTGEAVGIGIGSWLAVVAAGAIIVDYQRKTGGAPPGFAAPPPRFERDRRGLRFGAACRPDQGTLPVLCW